MTYSLFLSFKFAPFLASASTTCLRLGNGEPAAQCYVEKKKLSIYIREKQTYHEFRNFTGNICKVHLNVIKNDLYIIHIFWVDIILYYAIKGP